MATPVRAAWSVGGTGTALRSCTRHDEAGVFAATTWVTVAYLPVWPLRRARYRLLDRGWRFPLRRSLWVQALGPLPLARAEVARTLALAWLGAPLALFGPTALLGLPGVLLGLPKVAAVGAALSALWVMPVGVGALLWVQGLPWPARLPSARAPALLLALRQTGPRLWGAVGLAAALLGGAYALLVTGVELHGGAAAEAALRAALQSAAFIGALSAVVGLGLWLKLAWRVVENDVSQADDGGPPGVGGRRR